MIRFDWSFPYPSRRVPLLARNVVVTSQPLAAQAGATMLARGGNAVDAALATAITLTLVEPTSNGIGSDLFAILWTGRELIGLNASGRSAASVTRERYEGQERIPERGWEAVTIPGAVSGWVTLSQRFGKLPFADLFAPAIRYARDGFAVSPTVAAQWARAEKVLPHDLGWAEHFLPRGRVPLPGERFACPPMAETLEKIALSAGEAFYRGELAHRMVAHARQWGAVHALEDFDAHCCDYVVPLAQPYRELAVHEIPPNGQGISALIALGILGHFDLGSLTPDSVESQHLQIEAMKLGFADAYRYVSDPRAMPFPPRALLDPEYLRKRAGLIDRRRAQRFGPGEPPRGGTVYLAAADERGMIVSLIQSNYMGFGSGVVVPGTGISLQNRGAGFSLVRGHPNEIGGGKRPFHTIIPGFVTIDGAPYGAFGVMGGPIQPPGHLQTVVRLADYRQNPQALLDAPRWKLNIDGSVDLEATASPALREGLVALGHAIKSTPDSYMDYGAGQFVLKAEDGYVAASDPRRDGYPVGF